MKPLNALEEFPVYIVTFFVSLAVATISDTILTGLALGCLALGFITSPLIAVAAFFFVYVGIRTVNTVANAIGNSGIGLTNELHFLSSLLAPAPPPESTIETPPTVTPLDMTRPDSEGQAVP